jgi:uncharacterized protein (TIGR00730 family)
MTDPRRLCVFCGSRAGERESFRRAAAETGRALARAGLPMVYGGGAVGLMGIAADACLAAGGEVIGVIPRALFAAEIAHQGVTTLHAVGSMHERKALMHRLSSGFLVLPGGLGTLDELFETLTWRQIGLHQKPVCVLDTDGVYEHLFAHVERMHTEGFIADRDAAGLLRARTVDEALALLTDRAPPTA